jgi:hypothetical protein
VSREVACVYTQRFIGNLLAVEGQGYRPVITSAFASEERPRWRDLVLSTLQEGMRTVVIMTDETHKRLWPRAAVLLQEKQDCRLLQVDFAQVRECLRLVEQVGYSAFVV